MIMTNSVSCSSTHHPDILSHSTGKERDAETGLDYFLARYYSGAQGRFLSPDEFKGGPDDALTGAEMETTDTHWRSATGLDRAKAR
jgi:RHS repeat-associated protein